MIYGELGVTPLYIDIQSRMISFWTKLVLNAENAKLSSTVYAAMYCLQEENQIRSQWLDNVKIYCVQMFFSGVWYSQSFINPTW